MKYLYLISIFLAFNLKNLSAYQEITIQKDSNLQNYQELLLRINNSITEEDIISSIEKNIYNINFSNTQISLNVDVDNLSKDLYAKNIDHNLFFLNCSLQENFFEFNNTFENCPNVRTSEPLSDIRIATYGLKTDAEQGYCKSATWRNSVTRQ